MRSAGKLTERDAVALAEFFSIFWAVVALAPREQQSIRGAMRKLGLVKAKGALALSPSGERAIAAVKAAYAAQAPRASPQPTASKPRRNRRRPLKKSRPESSPDPVGGKP